MHSVLYMTGAYALIAFFGLTTIHVSAAILYKYSQSGGKYAYSPATTLVLAEVFKFFMSAFMHCGSVWAVDPRASLFARLFIGFSNAYREARKQVNARIVGQLCGLALSYAIYNQLQFLVFMWADAASVVLLRSSGSFIAALMAFFLLHRVIVRLQWLNILLQVFGLIIVQYDSCKAQTTLPPVMYVLLFLHVSLSSFNSIWNEHLVKSKTAPSLNVQNAVLYAFGTLFNFIAYLTLPDSLYGVMQTVPVSNAAPGISQAASSSSGFFHGYTFITILIVILNSVIGIAITAVYKYADVIIKTFSLACATGTLFIVDWLFFNRSININVFLGIVVVYGASYLYFSSARAATLPTVSASGSSPETLRLGKIDKEGSDTTRSSTGAISPRGGWSLTDCTIFVPEFLFLKRPSKTVSLCSIILLVMLFGYLITHAGDLGKKYQAPQTVLPSPVPESLAPVIAAPKSATAPVVVPADPPEEWNPAVVVKTRRFEPKNRLDSLANGLAAARSFHQDATLNLAVCFIESPPTKHVPMARWEVELDFFASSRFDKLLVHDSGHGISFAPRIRPIATLNTSIARFDNSTGLAGPDSYCHLSDWLRTVAFAKSCLDALDYHMMASYSTFQWLWIVEPSVSWKSSMPKISDLQASTVYLRSSSQDSITDISSIFGSVQKVREFVTSLHARVQKDILSSPSVLSSDLPSVVKAAAESSSTQLQATSWMPSRGSGETCINSMEAAATLSLASFHSNNERSWAIELGEYLG